MLDLNPYRTTVLASHASSSSRFVSLLWWLVYLHPVISLTMIYVCWTLTTVSLGRPPGFGEHPDNDVVHTVMHILAIPAALLTLAAPLLVPVGLVWGLTHPFAQRHTKVTVVNRVTCLSAYLLTLAFVACMHSSDPFGAENWFWD